tara:strand:+ start:427 stop:699 length:273 start_codon:yes stop_codon:yes gene_type:complete
VDFQTNNKNKIIEREENSDKGNENFKKIEKYQAGLQKFLEIRVKSEAIAVELTQDTFERFINIDSPEKNRISTRIPIQDCFKPGLELFAV